MSSSLHVGQTLVGRSGIPYHLQKVLYERKGRGVKNENPTHRIWFAVYKFPPISASVGCCVNKYSSNNDPYVVKPVNAFAYDQAFRIKKDLALSPFICLPVDGNDANLALVLQHYTEDFLSFMQSGLVSSPQVKRILLDVLKGVAHCHSKDWVHCGNHFPSNVVRLQRFCMIADDGSMV